MLELKSIEEEAADCRDALANTQVGDLVWLCHHEVLMERLYEPAENRINYILSSKSTGEQALRLRCFRPVDVERLQADAERRKADAECRKAYAEYRKANAECRKANAECQKANAEWQKADAERLQAYAEWQKAYAELQKADAERQKAYAEWHKADAEWQKADAVLKPFLEKHYRELFPDSPWNGRSIFDY